MKIVDGKEYIEQVRDLIIEYIQWLDRDLSFQEIDDELADPAKKYTAPEGEFLVVIEDSEVLGMVAYHRLSNMRCEMKRLYVKPKYRGMNLGETLITEIILACKIMVLDTITPLKSAIYLYQKLGFKECKPYYHNPMTDVLYFSKKL